MTEVGGLFYASDKNGESRKTFLKGYSIKEKAWGLFHSCFAHWLESSGGLGNGVIGSVEVRSAEGHVTLLRVMKKHNSKTAHTHSPLCFSLTQTLSKCKKNQKQKSSAVKTYPWQIACHNSSVLSIWPTPLFSSRKVMVYMCIPGPHGIASWYGTGILKNISESSHT